MTTTRTILLATDLSCRCDRALDRATMLAVEWRARLVVLHVIAVQDMGRDVPSWRRTADPLAVARERVLSDIEGTTGVNVEVIVEVGEPAPVILDAVKRHRADLVVTGVARDEALGRMLLGSTVESLARKSSVPLLVVKSRPTAPYRTVVVASDFSDGSRHALEMAATLLPDAQLILFHAHDVSYESFVGDRTLSREAARRNAIEESRSFLAASPALASSGRVVETLCEYGEVTGLLNDFTRARPVDLVVLGSHGRTGLADILLGSVARRLLDQLPLDVMVVRKPRG